MLHQAIYVSSTKGLPKSELDEILDTAIEFNAKNDITGFLLHDGTYFVQYLEGPKLNIDALLNKISKDPRHACFTVLEYGSTKQRVCPTWEMKLLLIDKTVDTFPDLPLKLDENIQRLVSNIFMLNRPV